MGYKEYVMLLDLLGSQEQHDRVRVRITTYRGKVTEFLIQYETFVDDEWRPVVRYDNHHGQGHRGLLQPNGETLEKLWLPDHYSHSEEFDHARQDILDNWPRYRLRFLEMNR